MRPVILDAPLIEAALARAVLAAQLDHVTTPVSTSFKIVKYDGHPNGLSSSQCPLL
jgi:hypothetical protein